MVRRLFNHRSALRARRRATIATLVASMAFVISAGAPALAGDPPTTSGDFELRALDILGTSADLGGHFGVRVTVQNDDAEAVHAVVTFAVSRSVLIESLGGDCFESGSGAISCHVGEVPGFGGFGSLTVIMEPQSLGAHEVTATVSGAGVVDRTPENNSRSGSITVENGRGCTIIGTAAADQLTGTSDADVICALGGSDTVGAGARGDVVYGGWGDDTLRGGRGRDNVQGGRGDDTVFGLAHADIVEGGDGSDVHMGGFGQDDLRAVDGVSANDTADGGEGEDTCSADAGDTITACE